MASLPTKDEPIDLEPRAKARLVSGDGPSLDEPMSSFGLEGPEATSPNVSESSVEVALDETSDDRPRSADAPSPFKDPLVGTMLDGRYEILEVIGRGGMGLVYRARQTAMNREVAVKVLRREFTSSERSVRRFENEAKIISKLRHPNTLRIYDCHSNPNGGLYIVTELLTGISLFRLMVKKAGLSVERSLKIADQVAAALSEAHAAGIIHRDVKPDNVYIDWVGGEDVVKVIDFGVAKMLSAAGPALTTTGNIVGTPTYLAPEQALGRELTPRTDIYALGVLLYHMLTGAPPFKGTTPAETIQMHLATPPPAMLVPAGQPQVPPELEELVLQMLMKPPEQRPVSMIEVRERLKAVLTGKPADEALTDPAERAPAPAAQVAPASWKAPASPPSPAPSRSPEASEPSTADGKIEVTSEPSLVRRRVGPDKRVLVLSLAGAAAAVAAWALMR